MVASLWSGSWNASQLPLNQIEATASNVRKICYVIETEDPRKLAEFSLTWSDLMELRIIPVLDDEDSTTSCKSPEKQLD
jgi:Protein of unknown function (DUF3303)